MPRGIAVTYEEREYMPSNGGRHQSSFGAESPHDVVAILQPRNVLFQLFDLRTEVAAVLKVLFGCAAFRLQTIMFAAQRRRLLFQRLVLGLEWGQISGRRLSSHDG